MVMKKTGQLTSIASEGRTNRTRSGYRTPAVLGALVWGEQVMGGKRVQKELGVHAVR